MFKHLEAGKDDNTIGENLNDVSCGEDPIDGLKKMFVDMVMGARIGKGQEPVQRPVFLKPHGVAKGSFIIHPDLPEDLQVGVFQHEKFEAWVRFSSDTIPSQPDLKTTVGIGIKLFDVPGQKLLEPETNAKTHDFIFQNHDVFFVDTAKDMCEFTYAGVVLKDYQSYLDAHPVTSQILKDMEKVVPSLLTTNFWSVLPYRFGAEKYVKYKLVPCDIPETDSVSENEFENPYYLHKDLRERLLRGEACFKFLVQFQTDSETMPLDRATVRWDESLSEPINVATLVLPAQDIDARGQATYGENLSYNPWHALAEHQPFGSISDARKVVYEAAAELRRDMNGVPIAEPVESRPLKNLDAQPKDTRIVRAAIHPAIGIARVGNSEEFFIGPEVVAPLQSGPSKDERGALKRQAARFRIYGYNAAEEVVGELTSNDAEITWTVHVANKKAAWYQFQLAMDIPEASAPGLDDSVLRNKDIKGNKRQNLIIDPGPRSISGANKAGDRYKFDTGKFFETPVYLGELRTDDAGRLLFLGGRGVSASYKGPNEKPTTFANNDGWHDDTSDGPVTATVNIRGREIPVAPAWAVTAPPNFAPDVIGVRTMYDLMLDVFVQDGRMTFPSKISFTNHIYPILYRLSNLQWVNQGFASQFGYFGQHNFLNRQYVAKLAAKDGGKEDSQREMRRQICNSFRDFVRDGFSPVPWPWLYGDAMNVPPADTPREHVAITQTQQRMLQLWVEGKFESDWDENAEVPDTLDKVALAEQPETLDRAALEFCLADAFHPGCEMTWPMRHSSMYMAPFRIRHRQPEDDPERIYGGKLTPSNVMLENGVLYGQSPGTITRWMAVPWQTDTASCRSGYAFTLGFGPLYDPYIATFWPARVPNHVLTEVDYQTAIDPNKPREERVAAFNQRAMWLRVLSQNYLEAIDEFVHKFGDMGVVEMRQGVKDDPELPEFMLVESRPNFTDVESIAPNRNLIALHVSEAEAEGHAEAASLAATAADRTEEEFMSGYIEKVRRFKDVR
jgi:hypothetical protein